jgi:hypothetical protein
MWAMLAAPLLAGNDLPNMKPEIKAILTNRDVIAIDQDRWASRERRVYSDGEVEVWTRHLCPAARWPLPVLNAAQPLLHPPVPSEPGQARPARPAEGQKICGRARSFTLTENHAARTRQPRHSAGSHRWEVRA